MRSASDLTGRITGSVAKPGIYQICLTESNRTRDEFKAEVPRHGCVLLRVGARPR